MILALLSCRLLLQLKVLLIFRYIVFFLPGIEITDCNDSDDYVTSTIMVLYRYYFRSHWTESCSKSEKNGTFECCSDVIFLALNSMLPTGFNVVILSIYVQCLFYNWLDYTDIFNWIPAQTRNTLRWPRVFRCRRRHFHFHNVFGQEKRTFN